MEGNLLRLFEEGEPTLLTSNSKWLPNVSRVGMILALTASMMAHSNSKPRKIFQYPSSVRA